MELDTQTFTSEPRDRDISKTEIGSNQQRIVGSPMEPDNDRVTFDSHVSSTVYQISEDMSGFGCFVAVAHPLAQEAIEA